MSIVGNFGEVFNLAKYSEDKFTKFSRYTVLASSHPYNLFSMSEHQSEAESDRPEDPTGRGGILSC